MAENRELELLKKQRNKFVEGGCRLVFDIPFKEVGTLNKPEKRRHITLNELETIVNAAELQMKHLATNFQKEGFDIALAPDYKMSVKISFKQYKLLKADLAVFNETLADFDKEISQLEGEIKEL